MYSDDERGEHLGAKAKRSVYEEDLLAKYKELKAFKQKAQQNPGSKPNRPAGSVRPTLLKPSGTAPGSSQPSKGRPFIRQPPSSPRQPASPAPARPSLVGAAGSSQKPPTGGVGAETKQPASASAAPADPAARDKIKALLAAKQAAKLKQKEEQQQAEGSAERPPSGPSSVDQDQGPPKPSKRAPNAPTSRAQPQQALKMTPNSPKSSGSGSRPPPPPPAEAAPSEDQRADYEVDYDEVESPPYEADYDAVESPPYEGVSPGGGDSHRSPGPAAAAAAAVPAAGGADKQQQQQPLTPEHSPAAAPGHNGSSGRRELDKQGSRGRRVSGPRRRASRSSRSSSPAGSRSPHRARSKGGSYGRDPGGWRGSSGSRHGSSRERRRRGSYSPEGRAWPRSRSPGGVSGRPSRSRSPRDWREPLQYRAGRRGGRERGGGVGYRSSSRDVEREDFRHRCGSRSSSPDGFREGTHAREETRRRGGGTQGESSGEGRTLFVGDLPMFGFASADLQGLFEALGLRVESARVMGSQCYGFVEFATAEEAVEGLAVVQSGDPSFAIEGRALRASWARGTMPVWKRSKAVIRPRLPGQDPLEGLEAYEHPSARLARVGAGVMAVPGVPAVWGAMQGQAAQVQMQGPDGRGLISYEDV